MGGTFFNIVGRLISVEDRSGKVDPNKDGPEIMRARYSHSISNRPRVSIIFDITPFEENNFDFYKILNNRYARTPKSKRREYHANIGPDDLTKYNWKEVREIKTGPGAGFLIRSRIAPRFFRGVVVGYFLHSLERDINKSGEQRSIIDESPEGQAKFQKAVESVKEIMLKKVQGGSLALPVYGASGNLIWPKQMSYEEVKKFVERRDKDKKEKE